MPRISLVVTPPDRYAFTANASRLASDMAGGNWGGKICMILGFFLFFLGAEALRIVALGVEFEFFAPQGESDFLGELRDALVDDFVAEFDDLSAVDADDMVVAGVLVEDRVRSEEHTSELQSRPHLVC